MGIPTTVARSMRFVSAEGCEHEVLLVAQRPSSPDHDAAAADAADGFCESALDHLRGWFAMWVLPTLCRHEHGCEHLGDEEDGWLPGAAPFTWIDLTRTVHGDGWMTVGEGTDTVSAYLLTIGAGRADLGG